MGDGDWLGFREPLDKLVQLVSASCGTVIDPIRSRRMAKASSFALREMSSAACDAGLIPKKLIYQGGGLTFQAESGPQHANLSEEDGLFVNRALMRQQFMELKRQQNLERIVGIAANELENEDEVTEEPIDEDWASRFFGITQDISTEQMQDLWGRILAGEIKHPGAYSLRTLEALKNITKEEAEIFSRVARISIRSGSGCSIASDIYMSYGDYGVSDSDILTLQSIHLLFPQSLPYALDKDVDFLCVVYGDNVLIARNIPKRSFDYIYSIPYTQTGYELLGLLDIVTHNNLLPKLAQWLRITSDVNVSVATLKSLEPKSGVVEFENEVAWRF
ncbi:MAG: DUF2806 domain-containing protein [Deltaproteobacteria bacterium]|nr:DUF2806 domain-containing protein [Deltaproteobacteria bacterium]